MVLPRCPEAARGAPRIRGWVVELRGVQEGAAAIATCDQDFPIGQQRGGVVPATRVKASRVRPGAGRRIVQLSGCRPYAVGIPPPATRTLPAFGPEVSSVAEWSPRAVARLPVSAQVPVAGSYSSAVLENPPVGG